MKFNINNYVKVKLTDKGKDIYFHRHDEINAHYKKKVIKPSYPKADDDGYTKFQLWNLMEIYGKYCTLGSELPFDSEIIFEEKE